MPVFKDLDITFIHIPKTGGTSVARMLFEKTAERNKDYKLKISEEDFKEDIFLENLYNGNEELENIFAYKRNKHFSYHQLKNLLPDVKNIKKIFTVVREPYARAVSAFNHKLELYVQQKPELLDNDIRKTFLNILNYCLDKDKKQTIKTFNRQASYLYENWHSKKYICPKIKIIKYENLEKDIKEYLPELNIDKLPRIIHRDPNKKIYSKYQLYNDESIQFVQKYYEEDFKSFGYDINFK